jgi:proteasome lid subunit RPN8/RPN11
VTADPRPAPSLAAHPGPASITLSAGIVQAIVDHARAEDPNEACGVIVGDRPAADGGEALRWVPMRNTAASPFRYRMDDEALLRLTIETDDADEVFWAIVHSHVRSAAYPSPTDVNLAIYRDAIFLLVSLEADEPALGAFRIVDEAIFPVELLVGATT